MFEYLPGATPLDPDEASGLIPAHITTLPVFIIDWWLFISFLMVMGVMLD